MSLSRRARKQLIAFGVAVALVLIVAVGGNQLRLARKSSSAAEGLKRGTEAFEAGNYEQTLTQLNRYFVIAENQNDSDAVYMQGKARLEVPQDGGAHFRSALAFARRAVDNDPSSVRNRLLVLEVLSRSSNASLPELLEAIDNVLNLDPSRTDLRLERVALLHASGRTDAAIEQLRALVNRDQTNLDAINALSLMLRDRPAEYNQWIAELDQRASSEAASEAEKIALNISRIKARLGLIPNDPKQAAANPLAATRTLGAFDILTQDLLTRASTSPTRMRAVLDAADQVERAVRLTSAGNPQSTQATAERLEAISTGAMEFIDRHTQDPALSREMVLASLEWLWTSDRVEQAGQLAARWREASPASEISTDTEASVVAIESLIAMARMLPAEQRSPNVTRIATDNAMIEDSEPGVRLWTRLAAAVRLIVDRDYPEAEAVLQLAGSDAEELGRRLTFSSKTIEDRTNERFVVSLASPMLGLLAGEVASASGDSSQAISNWYDAARQRQVWDLPALNLLSTFRDRGSLGDVEAMSMEAAIRGADLATGLSVLESRVDQYALGLLSYDATLSIIEELTRDGFPEPQLAVARIRLAILGSIKEPDRASELASEVATAIQETASRAENDLVAAETLVRMLRTADELRVLSDPAFVPESTAQTAMRALNAQFTNLGPESKLAASLVFVARTGVYGPALEQMTSVVQAIENDPAASATTKLDHQRILARFTSELARTYPVLEQDAYDRVRAFAESHPANSDAQLFLIDYLLRAGVVPQSRNEAMAQALDRLRSTLGEDSYAYNFAESRRLYIDPNTRTPEVARQEIISRLDRFVEGPQSGSATAEVLHLTALWWELLPNSLERRLRYLKRAQSTSSTSWGLYPDLVRVLVEAGEWDDAAAMVAAWQRQFRPSVGLRSERRDLAQIVGNRFNLITQQSDDARSREIQSAMWSFAVNDAVAIAQATSSLDDQRRLAQVVLAAPDQGAARQYAMERLGYDAAAARRVEMSRPATIGAGVGVADITIAAAVEIARDALGSDTARDGLSGDSLSVIANTAQLIAENATVARFTELIASGRTTDYPASIRLEPDPEAALQALTSAVTTGGDMQTRAIAHFYAMSYQPDSWQQHAEAARSAMLAAASFEGLTETESRQMVYPLSQLGEVETAIQLQQAVTRNEEGQSDSNRIRDVIAIAEILREAGRTDDAYAVLDSLSEEDRNLLTTSDAPVGPQALVSLLELEARRPQTPVTNAFTRRVIANPQDSLATFELALLRAADSHTRRELLNRVSDDLVAISDSDDDEAPDFRRAVAALWFTAATAAPESDPMRRDLFTRTITRLNAVLEIDDPGAKSFAYRRKAFCEIELGAIDTGIRTYRQALELEPNDSAALNNLADALKRRGQYAEAIQVSERAVEAAENSRVPDSVRSVFYDTLGGSRLAAGNVPDALAALQTAVTLNPSNASARVTLAEAQLEAGQDPEAVLATIAPIGPAAEQELKAGVRERLEAVRTELGL